MRKQSVVDCMLQEADVSNLDTIVEIGCGDGFLTSSLIKTECKNVIVYEIDKQWTAYVNNNLKSKKLIVKNVDILSIDWEEEFARYGRFLLLSNLPYNISFPILSLIKKHRLLLKKAIVMIQEEVAQKIVATKGRTFSPLSLDFQHHFNFKLLDKVEPDAFVPSPKVFSRLLLLDPKLILTNIVDEDLFWKFVKSCFHFPRQTLKNNLKTTQYSYQQIPNDILSLRARQLSMEKFVNLWNSLKD